MKVQGMVTVNAPQQQVWQALLDPVQLCKVIPGCENVRQVDATHYEADLSIKVQFMTIRTQAKGTIVEAIPPRHLVVEMVGESTSMAAAFRARVTLDLSPVNHATNIRYDIDLTLLGRLASMGEAIVRSTSKQFSQQFADSLTALFQNPS